MASGKIHEKDAKVISRGYSFIIVLSLTLYLVLGYRLDQQILVYIGYVLILAQLPVYINPDLDLTTLTAVEYRLIKKYGMLGGILVGFWVPYSRLFKHRSFFSHAPILSTIIRKLYILARLIVLDLFFSVAAYSLALEYNLSLVEYLYNADLYFMLAILLGTIPLYINDAAHWYRDFIWKGE